MLRIMKRHSSCAGRKTAVSRLIPGRWFLWLALGIPGLALGQDPAGSAVPWDSVSLAGRLRGGAFHLQAREFFMSTLNESGLRDYYALASSVALGYRTPSFKGLQAGIGGSFTGRIASSDLLQPNPVSGSPNRYEKGLFDLTHPASNLIPRLEELFLRYARGANSLTVGKQSINTPFINPQDGRMRPGFQEGAWLESRICGNISLKAGWLWKMAPRSTAGWYATGSSLGLYAQGIDESGQHSNYGGHTRSGGIGILGITQSRPAWTWQVWNYYVANILNTTLLQADWTDSLPGGRAVLAGLQTTLQLPVGEGGNSNPAYRYFPTAERSLVLSARVGYRISRVESFLNFTRITGDGRFLMPREWGREPFYTFLLRERNEGFGNLTAWVLSTSWRPARERWKAEMAGGSFSLPPVTNFGWNKYEMPSYYQVNGSLTRYFTGLLNGMNLQGLLVYKGGAGEQPYSDLKYVDNKIRMFQINLILNYQF